MTFLLFFKFFVSNISVHQYVTVYTTTGVVLLMMFLFCPLPVTQARVYFVCILSFHLHEFLFFITCNTHYLCTVDMAEAIKLKIFTSACPSVCLPLSLFCLPPRLRFFACVFSFCLYLFSVFLCVSVSLRVSLASAFISFLSSSVSLFLCVCL